MKARLLFFVLMMICSLSFGQNWQWTTKTALTDSLSDHRNACVYKSTFGPTFAFWDQTSGSGNTEIWGRDISTGLATPPFQILASAGKNYLKPVAFNINTSDTLFYLFFETDSAQNHDLWYLKYHNTGVFYGPFPLAVSSANESNLSVDNVNKMLVYEHDGAILTRSLFYNGAVHNNLGPITLIDSSNSHNPIINLCFIAWIKEDLSQKKVMLSRFDGWPPQWTAPSEVYAGTDISRVVFGKANESYNDYLFWDDHNSDSSFFMSGQLYQPGVLTNVLSSTVNLIKEPDEFTLMIPIDVQLQLPGFFTYVSDETGNDEVYLYDPAFSMALMNLSQCHTRASNPRFFQSVGLSDYLLNVLCVWEEEHNGNNHQIYFSRFDANIGRNDIQHTGQLSVYPNPAENQIIIEPANPEMINGIVKVSDMTGRSISAVSSEKNGNNVRINVSTLPSGLYFVELEFDGTVFRSKFIKH